MNQVSFYLDSRRALADGSFPVRIRISRSKVCTFVTTGIKVSADEWNSLQQPRIKDVRLRKIKNVLERKRMDVEDVVYDLESHGERITPQMVKDEYELRVNPEKLEQRKAMGRQEKLLTTWISRRMEMKSGKTRDSIGQTLARVLAFDAQAKLDDVSVAWLERFDAFMAKTAPSPNARTVHMRNLRAVMNFAIDEGATENYPFRRFRIKTVRTEKRSLPVEDLRLLLTMDVEDCQREYRDMFALSFYLMGINFADLMTLPVGADSTGRIVFNRSKTKKLYSMKIEPEAQEIIDRYRGEGWLLRPMDRYSWHEDFLKHTNKALRSIGRRQISKHGKMSAGLWPQLTTYWARHSWATIAASLDIPKETIAAALGHGGNTVTDIYIDFDRGKVDEANRRVIDWVLYGRAPGS